MDYFEAESQPGGSDGGSGDIRSGSSDASGSVGYPFMPPPILDDDIPTAPSRPSGSNTTAPSALLSVPAPLVVEGQPIASELYSRATPCYYRTRVTCPLHARCRKRRNCHERQCANFGELEVWAYLGVWLRKGQDALDRLRHKSIKPTHEEVKSYLTEHGY